MSTSSVLGKIARQCKYGINKILKNYGYQLVRDLPWIYLHEYSTYEEYAEVQKFHNRRKLQNVWADDQTLSLVADLVRKSSARAQNYSGICHGARNGFEVDKLRSLLDSDKIVGTDISETAEKFSNLCVWDFHDENPDWLGRFDFVYSNSLDQSWKPFEALSCWMRQIKEDGIIVIEHTRAHGVEGASSMDPFGVLPEFFPYVICEHFGRQISLEIKKSLKSNFGIDVWLFVIRKCGSDFPC